MKMRQILLKETSGDCCLSHYIIAWEGLGPKYRISGDVHNSDKARSSSIIEILAIQRRTDHN